LLPFDGLILDLLRGGREGARDTFAHVGVYHASLLQNLVDLAAPGPDAHRLLTTAAKWLIFPLFDVRGKTLDHHLILVDERA
jgi:hypothetical protein